MDSRGVIDVKEKEEKSPEPDEVDARLSGGTSCIAQDNDADMESYADTSCA